MKSKDLATILDAQENAIKLNLQNLLINFLPFAPMVEADGEAEIPLQPLTALQSGKHQTLTPMLAGTFCTVTCVIDVEDGPTFCSIARVVSAIARQFIYVVFAL